MNEYILKLDSLKKQYWPLGFDAKMADFLVEHKRLTKIGDKQKGQLSTSNGWQEIDDWFAYVKAPDYPVLPNSPTSGCRDRHAGGWWTIVHRWKITGSYWVEKEIWSYFTGSTSRFTDISKSRRRYATLWWYVFIVLGQPERIAGIMDLLHDPDRRAGDHGE